MYFIAVILMITLLTVYGIKSGFEALAYALGYRLLPALKHAAIMLVCFWAALKLYGH